jgi:hypothetical protein
LVVIIEEVLITSNEDGDQAQRRDFINLLFFLEPFKTVKVFFEFFQSHGRSRLSKLKRRATSVCSCSQERPRTQQAPARVRKGRRRREPRRSSVPLALALQLDHFLFLQEQIKDTNHISWGSACCTDFFRMFAVKCVNTYYFCASDCLRKMHNGILIQERTLCKRIVSGMGATPS